MIWQQPHGSSRIFLEPSEQHLKTRQELTKKWRRLLRDCTCSSYYLETEYRASPPIARFPLISFQSQ